MRVLGSARSRWAFRASKLSKDGTGTRKLPHVAHPTLHLPLVVALPGPAEPVLEQVVGLELGEGTGTLSLRPSPRILATASRVLS